MKKLLSDFICNSNKDLILNSIINQLDESIWIWDIELQKAFCSPNLYNLLGYNEQDFSFDKNSITLILPEDDIDNIEENYFNFLNSQSNSFCSFYRLKKKDQTTIWVEIKGEILEFNPLGLPLKILGFIKEISIKKNNEQQLTEKEEILAKLSETIEDIFYSSYLNGRIFDINEKSAEYFHLSIDNIKTLPNFWKHIIHPLDQYIIPIIISNLTNMNYSKAEYRVVTGNGEIKWVYDRAFLIKNNMNHSVFVNGIMSDITDKKIIEQELFEEKLLLQTLIDNIPDFIFYKDINSFYILCNKSFSQHYFGLDKRFIIGHSDLDLLLDHEKAQEYLKNDQLTISSGVSNRFEEWVYIANGSKVLLETLKTPIKNSEGEIIGLIGVSRDLTKREESQRKMNEQHTLLSETLKMSKMGYWQFDLLKKTFIISKELLKVLDFDTDKESLEIESKKFIKEFVHPDDYSIFKNQYKQILKNINNPEYNEEFVYKYISNEKIYYLHTRISFEFKNVFIGVCQDITETILAQKEAKHKELLLESIAFATNQLYEKQDFSEAIQFSFEKLGNVLDVDKIYLLKINQGNENSLIASQVYEWNSEHVKRILPENIMNNLDLSLFGEYMDLILENKIISDLTSNYTGAVYDFFTEQDIKSFLILPIFIDETIWGIIGFEECRTERIWSESEKATLKSFTSSIQNVVKRKQKEAELEKAKDSAIQANKAKSEFLANMSHEIRTPMNGVIGMTDLALMTDLNSKQKEYLEAIRYSSDILLNIINDILDFSKIESGHFNLECIPLNLREIADTSIHMLTLKAYEKDIELFCDYPANLPDIFYGDPVRIRQIIINLLSNAVKFTNNGFISLKIREILNPQLTIDRKLIEIIVEDTGIGIDESKIEKIFESFNQADTSTSRQYGGTGLGLTISRQLVKMMGGEIGVKSTLEKGSIFYFSLPLKFETSIENSYSDLKFKKCLIIDDHPHNFDLISDILKNCVNSIDYSSNGIDALTIIEANLHDPYDFILLDLEMPFMSGWSVLEKIRLKFSLIHSAIILMSKVVNLQEQKFKAEKFNILDILKKPIKKNELINSLHLLNKDKHTSIDLSESSFNLNTQMFEKMNNFVMVAEDNTINRIILMEFLNNIGMTCIEAKDGKEALEIFLNVNLDLIFMDVQMPVMDGYDTTKKIREIENNSKHTPIIAMTANAMEGDREKCLEMGMDDYVSKPFKQNDLLQIINKWLSWQADNMILSQVDQTIDLNLNFKENQMNEIGVNEDIFNELITIYKESAPRLMNQIKEALTEKDLSKLILNSHTFKGINANMRFAVLTIHSEKLLYSARKNEDWDTLNMYYENLKKEFDRVFQDVLLY